MTNANIFWGLVAGAGIIVAAIGILWVWLAGAISIPAVWTVVCGAGLTLAGAFSIVE